MTSPTPPAGSHENQPGTEYLEQGGGAPLARESGSGGGGRRKAVLAGATVVGLAAVGGGVWAAASFFATGAQPAEALPASTVAYASIDLDPSGGQKIEALRMLNKFPAFEDKVGLGTNDDIKKKIFDLVSAENPCPGLDYEADVEPWLGDRAAAAVVDTGKGEPTFAGVLQVRDAEKAEEGLRTIRACSGDDEEGGWAIEGEWALLAETDQIAADLAADAATGSLAEDETYQRWTGEAGDAGVATLYAAPEAGKLLAENLMGFMDPFGDMAGTTASPASTGTAEPEVPEDFTKILEDFGGLAITVRFDDGAVEMESAGAAADTFPAALYGSGNRAGDDVLSTLPEDTAAAVGVGFMDGWFSEVLDEVVTLSGGQMTVEELIAEAEAETGLELPEDVETLAGDSAAIALGSDFDVETFVNSEDGSDVPVAVKVKGEPEKIEVVLEKLQAKLPGSDGVILGSDSDGELVAIGPNDDYRSQVLGEGDLGGTGVFSNVVREAGEASVVFFVNFDAGDGALTELAAEDDPELAENLEPLEGLGISSWQEGDVSHSVARVTTN